MDAGYVYVLANSAMPGLVKVGRTARSTAERAAELSRATGVPTPFIVVFEQLFEDCVAAEDFVHTYLQSKGFRPSADREFFNAPVADVVRAVMSAIGAVESVSAHDKVKTPNAMDSICPEPDIKALIGAMQYWLPVLDRATDLYFGRPSLLQDYRAAFVSFSEAAKLGSLDAYVYIGKMYRDGKGTAKNVTLAIETFKEGARKGSVACCFYLGMLYEEVEAFDNANKCFAATTEALLRYGADEITLTTNDLADFFRVCAWRTRREIAFRKWLQPAFEDLIRHNLRSVLDAAHAENMNVLKKPEYADMAAHWDETLDRIRAIGRGEANSDRRVLDERCK
ncbi:GIY-YIG nuclease family protein [Paraburkholderia sp. RL18-101-BIB-B]|jgi:hypothetical protein|uniref:GIY-YIG nuclease family protein n=1 Tax=Paraburkholderia sp. RL18-101-BIB-B TaxID=3031634 RepID=UPI0038BD5702